MHRILLELKENWNIYYYHTDDFLTMWKSSYKFNIYLVIHLYDVFVEQFSCSLPFKPPSLLYDIKNTLNDDEIDNLFISYDSKWGIQN